MTIGLVSAMILGAIAMVAGWMVWRQGLPAAWRIVACGAAIILSAASGLAESDTFKYVAWTIIAALLLLQFLTLDLGTLRASRPVLLVGGALISVISLSVFTDVQSDLHDPLLVLIVLLFVVFVAVLTTQSVKMFRSHRASKMS
jgi:hypothetical protein